MADLMNSLSLSKIKQYVIASDYFIDLVRAFMVVPVNVRLYNSIAKDMITDYNKDGYLDINDFFEEVFNVKWTYTRLADYCQKIFAEGTAGVPGASMDDTLGFALGRNGLPAAGLVYSSSVDIISEEWIGDRYDYYYPEENEELFKLADAIKLLFNQRGVLCVTRDDAQSVDAATANLGVRTKFVNDQLLFGGIILLGSIEYEAYQNMKKSDDGGFGIVPVPLYREGSNDKYLTHIHVIGRAGAIARNTKKFVQCSAFLHYQSCNSLDIKNDYYEYTLVHGAAAGEHGVFGNIEMLKYIRQNVRTSFDKLYEDAIGFMYADVDENSVGNRFHNLLCSNGYQLDDIATKYAELQPQKASALKNLEDEYAKLPA